jgi:hypothetical protein
MLYEHRQAYPQCEGILLWDLDNEENGWVLDSQPQVIKFNSCLPMVGGSLTVLRLLPPLKLIAML